MMLLLWWVSSLSVFQSNTWTCFKETAVQNATSEIRICLIKSGTTSSVLNKTKQNADDSNVYRIENHWMSPNTYVLKIYCIAVRFMDSSGSKTPDFIYLIQHSLHNYYLLDIFSVFFHYISIHVDVYNIFQK